MLGIINYEQFVIAVIILTLIPGADTIYIFARSISQGKKAGILSILGVSTGVLIQLALASVGLSIILTQYALVFQIVKYLGAIYLIYIGIKALTEKTRGNLKRNTGLRENTNYKKIYMSGILNNLSNPKVVLFFLAFLPQFIDPNYSESSMSFVFLGLTFLLIGVTYFFIIVAFASKFSEKMMKNSTVQTRLNKITGGIFILLGIELLLTKK